MGDLSNRSDDGGSESPEGGDSAPDDTASESADTLRERAGENRVKLWVFYQADRRLLAVVCALGVFAVLVTAGALQPDVTAVLRQGDPIGTTFQAFVGAIITGVTLVVTLNQLVLSQEFGTIDEQQDRFEQTMAVRKEVSDHVAPAVAPSDPSTFLRALVDAAATDATEVREHIDEGTPDAIADALRDLAESIESNAATVSEQLEDARFGSFDVVSAALDFNYSLKIYDARRIQAEHEAAVSDDLQAALDELVATLELFAPAREHVKTLYLQWELINLSRYVLASALPALLASVYMLLFYELGTPGGAVLGIPTAVIVVSAAVTVAVSPFLVLVSYVLRVATVTKRTLAIGPFTIRDTADRDE